MQGVTTAIVLFIFACMALPHLVKNRAQFYAALVAVLLVIVLDTLAHMFGSEGLARFAYVCAGFLQIVAIVLLVLAVGGLSAREFAGELHEAYEVIRRGGEEKEIIIPIRGNMPNAPAKSSPTPVADEPKTYTLDEAGNEIPTPKPAEDDKGSIPLV